MLLDRRDHPKGDDPMNLKAIALNGTLKSGGGEPSSTDRMLDLIGRGLREMHVEVKK